MSLISLILVSLLILISLNQEVLVYGFKVGCPPKPTNKKLGPQYVDDHSYCLSTTKTLLRNNLVSSRIQQDGYLMNSYQLEWSISLCNECPHYDIFNITTIDMFSLLDLDLHNAQIENLEIALLANNEVAQSSFTINELTILGDNCNLSDTSLNCSLFGCPSSLSHYHDSSCDQCTPDRECALFNMSITFDVIGTSATVCPSYSTNVTNCIYSAGTICNQYTGSRHCHNCKHLNFANKKPSRSLFSSFFSGMLSSQIDISKSSVESVSLLSSSVNSIMSYPDLTPVCAKSCASPTPIIYSPLQSTVVYTPVMHCYLTDDQCNQELCKNQACDNAVFNCTWVLLDENLNEDPFNFTLSLPFVPNLFPSSCIQDPNDLTGTTLLCGVVTGVSYPIWVEGTLCVKRTNTFSNLKIDATVEEIITGGCTLIQVKNVSVELIVPPNDDVNIIDKTAVNSNNQPIEAIDCSDPSVASQYVYYRIDVNSPTCTDLAFSFDDESQYDIDKTYGLIISPSTSNVNCTLSTVANNTFNCYGSISKDTTVSITYRILVSCSPCNTFDSAACLNNKVSNNLTHIIITSPSCPINVPREIDFITPIACPCPVCDCTVDFSTFNTSTFEYDSYLSPFPPGIPSSSQNLTSNYVTCIVYNNDINYSPYYSSPIYGWFQHVGTGIWITQPVNILQNTLTGQMILASGQHYTMSCCGYQNTHEFRKPDTNSPIMHGNPLKFYYTDGEQKGTINSNWKCNNNVPSTSFPSHYPIFRKVVG